MKYVLLIHQGSTPVPGMQAWDDLSKDEQTEIWKDYQALNGFCFYEADDLDAAIALAARIPAARLGGAIEVRPTKEW